MIAYSIIMLPLSAQLHVNESFISIYKAMYCTYTHDNQIITTIETYKPISYVQLFSNTCIIFGNYIRYSLLWHLQTFFNRNKWLRKFKYLPYVAYSVTGEKQNPGYTVFYRDKDNMYDSYCFSLLNPYRPPTAVNTASVRMARWCVVDAVRYPCAKRWANFDSKMAEWSLSFFFRLHKSL